MMYNTTYHFFYQKKQKKRARIEQKLSSEYIMFLKKKATIAEAQPRTASQKPTFWSTHYTCKNKCIPSTYYLCSSVGFFVDVAGIEPATSREFFCNRFFCAREPLSNPKGAEEWA